MEQINIYDMLVFEDESGSIYQDCVCSISNECIKCNCATIILNNTTLVNIVWDDWTEAREENLKLKEIWTRTDEDTYKKVWENK